MQHQIFLVLVFASLSLGLRDGKCRMMAFEGGGTKGAYQAGVFDTFVNNLPANEVIYDVVTGASVGTLNGLLLAAFPKGQEKKASEKLTSIYMNIKKEHIYADWPFPYLVSGFISKPSFLDSSVELAFLEREFKALGGKIYRKFEIGVTDAQDGSYFSVGERAGADRLPFYVAGSSAMPGIFTYLKEGNKVLVDGGTINNLNLRNGIERCLESVTEENIIVDVIMTNSLVSNTYDMSKSMTYDVYQRGSELSKAVTSSYHLLNTIRVYPKINWRYIVIPKSDISGFMGVSLTFDHQRLLELWNIGRAEGLEVIKNSKGNAMDVIHEISQGIFKRRRLIK